MKTGRLASELWLATRVTVALLLLGGIVYPALVWGVARVAFPWQSEGSLVVSADGRVAGSDLIGQKFVRSEYFHGRPSAAAYDGASSTGSNIGPTNAQLLNGNGASYGGVTAYAAAYRKENGLDASTALPADAATASGSGLDPHISPANAELQVGRVAAARGPSISAATLRSLIGQHTSERTLGFLGELRVNVLRLNLALDSASAAARSRP